MKRKHIPKFSNIFRCFPVLIWKHCYKCKEDFVREWGWRMLVGPYRNGCGTWKYVCKRCAPTKKMVNHIISESKKSFPNILILIKSKV